MRKRYVLVLLAAFTGLTAGVAFAVAANGSSGPIVKTPGGEIFKVNKEAGDTLHFAPAVITVTSGESVTFEKTDKGPDPHTVTIATSKAQLPRSFESPCKPCDAARGHLKNPKSQQGPPQNPVAHWVLDKGQPGFDTFGDSVVLAPKGPHKSATVVISAPAGTTLYFVCAIHPWMQGKIIVK